VRDAHCREDHCPELAKFARSRWNEQIL